jgi:hypothetical protein
MPATTPQITAAKARENGPCFAKSDVADWSLGNSVPSSSRTTGNCFSNGLIVPDFAPLAARGKPIDATFNRNALSRMKSFQSCSFAPTRNFEQYCDRFSKSAGDSRVQEE